MNLTKSEWIELRDFVIEILIEENIINVDPPRDDPLLNIIPDRKLTSKVVEM